MANNRLYIVDPGTGKSCMIAKALGNGWYTTPGMQDRLDEFFSEVDESEKPIDWQCSAGLDECSTRLLLLDESQYDPGGMAADKRNIVRVVKAALRGNK